MLKIENLYKTYDSGLPTENKLFEGLNFNVTEGDFISIVGSNGSGKTSLLNIIAGTVTLNTGKIFLSNEDISKKAEFKKARQIARVFQDPKMGTCSTMTVAENLAMAENKNKPYGLTFALKKHNRPKYQELLKSLEMGIEDKLDVLCGSLSGGQRQALALLMASITKPELLLLDEHTAALDPRTSENIMRLTKDVVEKNHITTLMVTHNLSYAIEYGNRMIMMHKGNILFDVAGEEKKHKSTNDLINLFHKAQGTISDTMAFS
jgi:putative ABC transport system ATP-binding protein